MTVFEIILILFDIYYHILGFGACFELYRPVGNAGCDDKVGTVSFFIAVGTVVCAYPLPYVRYREKLSAVGMTRKHKVSLGL